MGSFNGMTKSQVQPGIHPRVRKSDEQLIPDGLLDDQVGEHTLVSTSMLVCQLTAFVTGSRRGNDQTLMCLAQMVL